MVGGCNSPSTCLSCHAAILEITQHPWPVGPATQDLLLGLTGTACGLVATAKAVSTIAAMDDELSAMNLKGHHPSHTGWPEIRPSGICFKCDSVRCSDTMQKCCSPIARSGKQPQARGHRPRRGRTRKAEENQFEGTAMPRSDEQAI